VQAARLPGAGTIFAIDHHPRRLDLAVRFGAHALNYEMTDVVDELAAMTPGIGPDAVIDAVGIESHGFGNFAIFDKLTQRGGFGADTPGALRDATMACRKGGRVSAPARPLSALPAPSLAPSARIRP
jgi:threonine dehydrogenase-like Zn-dependent dehydrogenase